MNDIMKTKKETTRCESLKAEAKQESSVLETRTTNTASPYGLRQTEFGQSWLCSPKLDL